jgi:hypothetical protein
MSLDPDKILENIESSITLLYSKYRELASDEEIFYVSDQIFDNIEEIKRTIALLENNVILMEEIISNKQRLK